MQLRPGTRLGRYEVREKIGAGGMGVVYLAQDTTLRRPVALKVLPADLVRNEERLRRFEQEAYAASALNHPHILTVYEIGAEGGAHFIATELVEGVTLRKRAAGRRLPPHELLDVAAQIASALAAAHEAGIVHRDIKPENVMLRPDGYVKVLDFGLAKLAGLQIEGTDAATRRRGDAESSDDSVSPRPRVPASPRPGNPQSTAPGAVMGTVNYMSPEQARGLAVDEGTDIWSLGCVLHECVAGRDPFAGPTPSDTLSNILRQEPPPLSRQSADAPAELERIVAKALSKEREGRYREVQDLLVELKSLKQQLDFAAQLERSGAPDPRGAHASDPPRPARVELLTDASAAHTDEHGRAAVTVGIRPRVSASRRRRGLAAATAFAALVVVSAAALGVYKLVLPRLRPAHFQTTRIARLTNTGKTTDAAISPDGKYLAYVLSDAGQQSLWIRQTSTANDTQIVAPARVGFWGMTFSPGGDEIYYGMKSSGAGGAGALYRIPALGGTPVKVMDGVDGTVAFSPDGRRIAYVLGDLARGESGLYVANADGTNARQIASRRLPEYFVPVFYTGPSWSPDGKLIACAVESGSGGSKVILVDADGGEERVLTTRPQIFVGRVLWLPDMSGLLMVARSPEIVSSQIWHLSYPDGAERRVTNDLDDYRSLTLTADAKKLATVSMASRMSIWVAPGWDAARAEELPAGNVGWMGRMENIDTLPDGRVVYTSNQDGRPGVWLMNADGTNRRKLTGDSFAYDPTPSPDGRYILYALAAGGQSNIWRMSADGASAVRLTDGREDRSPAVTPDGRWVVYSSLAGGRMTLWKVALEGGAASRITDAVAYMPQVSPDGRFIAYSYSHFPNTQFIRNPSVTRIAVIPFEGGDPVKVFEIPSGSSVSASVRWARDGRAVLFTTNDGNTGNIWSQPLDGGKPTQLTQFKERMITTFAYTPDNRLYCVRGVLLRDATLITDLD